MHKDCINFARVLHEGIGRSKDLSRAFSLAEGLCTAAEKWVGCEIAGDLYALGQGAARSKAKAAERYASACEHAFSARACRVLARMVESGDGVKADARRARDLREQAAQFDD